MTLVPSTVRAIGVRLTSAASATTYHALRMNGVVLSACSIAPPVVPEPRSTFERLPHLPVALRRPDAWITDTAGFVIGPRDVERHAMVEDRERPELGAQALAGVAVDLLEAAPGGAPGSHAGQQLAHELACLLDGELTAILSDERVAAPRHQRARLQRCEPRECARPVLEVGITGIRRRAELDQVAAEQDLALRQPGHGVALGVAAPELEQPDFRPAKPDAHLVAERDIGPGEAGDRFHRLEQPGETLDLGLEVLCT